MSSPRIDEIVVSGKPDLEEVINLAFGAETKAVH